MQAKLSLKTLKGIPEDGLAQFIWDFYLDHFNVTPEPILPRGIRITELLITFGSEMDNGGILQYITNREGGSSADPIEMARRSSKALAEVKACLETLTLVGATECAKLLKEALALFQKNGWPSGSELPGFDTRDFKNKCDRLNARWFARKGEDSMHAKMWHYGERYLREHLEDCVVK
jgi:hypothetical protein